MDLDELERVARAATPGPWEFNMAGTGGRDGKLIYNEVYVYAPDCGVDDIAVASDIADPLTGQLSEANAAHIATFDPPTVLKLLAVVEAAKAVDALVIPPIVEPAFAALRAALDALEPTHAR